MFAFFRDRQEVLFLFSRSLLIEILFRTVVEELHREEKERSPSFLLCFKMPRRMSKLLLDRRQERTYTHREEKEEVRSTLALLLNTHESL